MAYPVYLRERACALRTEKHLSLGEVAERLALPKTTVYYRIKDLPLPRARRWSTGQRKGNRSMQNKWRLRREAAYAQGEEEWDNSDPAVVALATRWLQGLSTHTPVISVQFHI